MDFDNLYKRNWNLSSRSISFENPTGAKGVGGRAASPLGQGRKGDPARVVESGEHIELDAVDGNTSILQRQRVLTGKIDKRPLS